MILEVTLVVTGIDLSSESVVLRLGDELEDLSWSSIDGRTLVTVFVDEAEDPACLAVEAARRIEHAFSGAHVERVDEDLVGTSDIARRVGVTRESVRLWIVGKRGSGGFPDPFTTLGGVPHGTRGWTWRSVREWLVRTQGLRLEPTLSDEQVATINSHLARVPQYTDAAWRRVELSHEPMPRDLDQLRHRFRGALESQRSGENALLVARVSMHEGFRIAVSGLTQAGLSRIPVRSNEYQSENEVSP